MTLTVERLKELLHYDPETGVFVWLRSRRRLGVTAGFLAHGYRKIKVGGVAYPAHRLAWLYMTGEWPDAQIDHINFFCSDNRWANLRAATPSQNNAWRRSAIGPSKFRGVSWHKAAEKWRAQIKVLGDKKHLGSFKSRTEAAAAYDAAAIEYFGPFARTNASMGLLP